MCATASSYSSTKPVLSILTCSSTDLTHSRISTLILRKHGPLNSLWRFPRKFWQALLSNSRFSIDPESYMRRLCARIHQGKQMPSMTMKISVRMLMMGSLRNQCVMPIRSKCQNRQASLPLLKVAHIKFGVESNCQATPSLRSVTRQNGNNGGMSLLPDCFDCICFNLL